MTTLRYIEDFAAGETFETGSHTPTEEEALAFARAHDPQSFHVDPAEARRHPIFQGLTLSGFHTIAITHRLIFERDIGHAWGLIGKGLDGLRWRRPVRPGDTLRVRGCVVAVAHEPGQPAGTLDVEIETLNQRDEAVMTFAVSTLVPSRIVLARKRNAA
ncbi:MaoC/PaaZ C-terminal domain-containing protein [Sphingomonas xanthus]|uniref:Dehydratase n=1 Tax=Sphingomonas xanthus TaxID=2594473 RepID=A0A516IPA1_9SPHN|nr:MaoC/PaaZ C-terminal domain-containing protein [Sphingomonas xanthus]QDP18707.1 dehydratase [Sphingomonas xanthus]